MAAPALNTRVNIPQVNANSVSDAEFPRLLNQIQQNIIDGIMKLQQNAFNLSTVIGEEKTAYLTEDQFQAQAGDNWVLADGRNVTGSAFAKLYGSNALPDRRGTVSRMKDNGAGIDPAGDLALGTYEADTFKTHTHIQDAHTHSAGLVNAAQGAGVQPTSGPGVLNAGGAYVASATATNQSTGGAETRVKAIIANVFIRIN